MRFPPKLPNPEPKDPSVDILLAKAFLTLVACIIITINSCFNSSSSKFFLFIVNIVPVLFFAADFNLPQ